MHLPTLGADLSALLSRTYQASQARRARRAGAFTATAFALVAMVGVGASAAGCRDDIQADSPAPTLAPSAPPGQQSKPSGKCLSAAEILPFATLSDDFPLCVVGMHLSTYGGDNPSDPPFSKYGQPSWAKDETYDGPFTGGACERFPGDPTKDDGDDCATSVEHWSIGGTRDAIANRAHLRVTAGTNPKETAFSALAYVPSGNVRLTLVAHTSTQPAREGEVYLVRAGTKEEQFFIASSVNGLKGVALPGKPSSSQVFFYSGESPLYVFDPPTKKESGLYRTACDFNASPPTCTSAIVASWEDNPGLATSDVDGNVVAVHSGLVTGQTLVGFPAGTLSGATAGTDLTLDNPTGSTSSLTIIGGAGQPKFLVVVGTGSTGLPREIKLVPVTFEGTSATAGTPEKGAITAAAGARLQVFHDPTGELWIAVDSNGAAAGGQIGFLHLAARSE